MKHRFNTYDPAAVADRPLTTGDGVSLTLNLYRKELPMIDKEAQRARAAALTAEHAARGGTAPVLAMPPIKSIAPKDMRDKTFKVGDRVGRPVAGTTGARIRLCEVTSIRGPDVFLDHAKQPHPYPGRLLIL